MKRCRRLPLNFIKVSEALSRLFSPQKTRMGGQGEESSKEEHMKKIGLFFISASSSAKPDIVCWFFGNFTQCFHFNFKFVSDSVTLNLCVRVYWYTFGALSVCSGLGVMCWLFLYSLVFFFVWFVTDWEVKAFWVHTVWGPWGIYLT